MSSTQRLLVLGGSGYLGVHLVEAALCDPSWARVVLGARRPAEAPLEPAFEGHPRLVRRAVDLLGAGEPESALESCAPTHVVLAAADADGGSCKREPDRAEALNARVPGRVAAWCARRGARLVHCSTDLVFGTAPPPAGGFDEAHPVGPQGIYGETKARGELAVLGADPTALVARLPLLYGDGRGRPKGASDSLFESLAAGRRTVLFDDEWRQPAEVREVAEMLLELARGSAAGRLHLASAEPVTRAVLGRLCLEARVAGGAAPLPEPDVGPRSSLGLADSRPER
jgi:dTDP-4-dehydrorhamnose reductase